MINEYLVENEIEYDPNFLLSTITKIKGNGCCDYYCKPNSLSQLKKIISFCITENILFDVVGNVSNTYFLNNYRTSVIVSTLKVKEISFNNDSIICSCGVNLSKISRECVRRGFAGYEGFIGVPGTVGAAAINNTGAFQSSMHEIVKSVTLLNLENEIIHLTNKDLKYETRNSVLKSLEIKGFVLSVEIHTKEKEDITVLKQRVLENRIFRKNNIDGHRKSLGSVFVSPTLRYLMVNFRVRLFLKKICYAPFKILVKDTAKLKKINTFLVFLFLGVPQLAKHCDSLNRFCWEENTLEDDFMNYINTMQRLSKNKLKIEIAIKGNQ